jgi:hypothetical protein
MKQRRNCDNTAGWDRRGEMGKNDKSHFQFKIAVQIHKIISSSYNHVSFVPLGFSNQLAERTAVR